MVKYDCPFEIRYEGEEKCLNSALYESYQKFRSHGFREAKALDLVKSGAIKAIMQLPKEKSSYFYRDLYKVEMLLINGD